MKKAITRFALLFGLLITVGALLGAGEKTADRLPDPPEWQDVYVAGWGRGRIYRVASDGTVSVYARVPNPDQIVFDDDGALYAACRESIYKITPTPDGSPATEENGHVEEIATGIRRIRPLALDADGNLWAAEYVGKGAKLYKITPDGEKTVVDDTLSQPYGLAAGPDGHMYLAQLYHFKVYRYTLDGERTTLGRGPHWTRTPAFNSKGELHVLGGWGIVRMAEDGTLTTVTNWKESEDEVHHPVGLAFDANDTLYFTSRRPKDQELGYVYKVQPDGSRTIFARVGASPFYLAFWPKQKPEGEGDD